jgi:iron complex outermembrane recepter protein
MHILKAAAVGAAASVFLTFTLLSSAYALAAEPTPQPFDIRPQTLAAALSDFARQSHEEILFAPEIVAKKGSPGVRGTMEPLAALKILLKDSGLSYSTTPGGAILVGAGGTAAISATARTAAAQSQDSSTRSSLQLAQATAGATASPSAVDSQRQASASQPVAVEEVIVTAQKREERLQDVPVPVYTVNADLLAQSNQVRLQDYYSSIPGLNVSPAGAAGNEQMLTIRGVSSGAFTNSTVAVTVDDVPFASQGVAGNVLPELDPSDLERIEVLRGPQGTLYGASSMGGLLKFVTTDPSTDGFNGRVQTDIDKVANGANPGYGVRASLNVPASDTFAFRISGFSREDPAYIDNPLLNTTGVNEDRVYGGRFSALWRPLDNFSIKLSALYQDTKGDSQGEVDLPTAGYPQTANLGDLQEINFHGCCAYETQVQLYSAVMKAKLGNVDLTSVTGYNINKYDTSFDFSSVLGGLANQLYPGFHAVGDYAVGETDKFTQELRASLPVTKSIDWLIGGFYTHEKSPFVQDLNAQDVLTGAYGGSLAHQIIPNTYSEYAGFTDLTIRFTERFDVQVGARESHIDQVAEPVIQQGALFGPPGYTNIIPSSEKTSNVFTYLVTPRVRFTPDLMAYARIASGYRPGVFNNFNTDPNVPRTSNPDKTQNYELGLKGDFLHRALTVDASVYYIDWKDIQIELLDPANSQTYTTNGSRAKSEGVELAVDVRPAEGVTVAGWVTYSDAVLTESFPGNSPESYVYGPEGARLPYAARFSGNLAVNQTIPMGRISAFWGAQASYVGDRLGTFVAYSTAPEYGRAVYPEYTKIDLHTGVTFDTWTVNLYANNVADKRGFLGGGAGTYPAFAYYVIQPRTLGVTITNKF